jgi:general secretion pathway protein D
VQLRPSRSGRKRLLFAGTLLLCSWGPSALAHAQDPTRWTVFEKEPQLIELVDVCAELLHVTIEYTPSELQGSVALRVEGAKRAEELWAIANRTLAGRGFTSVQMAGSDALSIVQLANAASLARLEEADPARSRAGFVKVLRQLQREKAESVATAVQLVLSKSGTVTPLREQNALLLTDFSPNVLQALRVVDVLDGSQEALGVEEVRVRETSSVALVALLERILNAKKAVFGEKIRGTALAAPERGNILVVAPPREIAVWRELIERFDQAEGSFTENYLPRRFGVKETSLLIEQVVHGGTAAESSTPWRIVTDELTGALVVTATPSQHAEIKALLERLESTELGPRRSVRSYPIKYRGVREVASLLEGLIEQGILRDMAAEPGPSAEKTGGPQPTGPTAPIVSSEGAKAAPRTSEGGELKISADEATNRIVAIGEARLLDQLAHLIESLDVKATQVLVEAMVVTLTDNQTRELGVELQDPGSHNGTLARFASIFGLGSPDPTAATLPAATGSGFSAVVLDPGEFSAIVRALQTINKGRSLTIPKLLVNNNQEATLGSLLQTPYLSTNASTTVATTSFGGSLDAGTSITVKPQITQGDQLLLDYSVSLSSFVGAAASPNLPPPRQEQKLASIATVPDGYTVVLGGLEIETEADARSQVPLLGDIPIVGALFRNRSTRREKSRFFVFIRASVMRSQGFADLRYKSGDDLQVAGVDDGWPVLEPRIIR